MNWSQDEHVYHYWWDSLCYSPTNTISHCRRIRFVLEMNTSGASDVFYAGVWKRTCFSLEFGGERVSRWSLDTNTLVLETNALKCVFKLQSWIPSYTVATSYFQTEHLSRWLLLTHRYMYLPPETDGIALSYSPGSTVSHCRHPQIISTQ